MPKDHRYLRNRQQPEPSAAREEQGERTAATEQPQQQQDEDAPASAVLGFVGPHERDEQYYEQRQQAAEQEQQRQQEVQQQQHERRMQEKQEKNRPSEERGQRPSQYINAVMGPKRTQPYQQPNGTPVWGPKGVAHLTDYGTEHPGYVPYQGPPRQQQPRQGGYAPSYGAHYQYQQYPQHEAATGGSGGFGGGNMQGSGEEQMTNNIVIPGGGSNGNGSGYPYGGPFGGFGMFPWFSGFGGGFGGGYGNNCGRNDGAYATFGDVATLQAIGDGTRDAVQAVGAATTTLAGDIGETKLAAALQTKNLAEQMGAQSALIISGQKDGLIVGAQQHGSVLKELCDVRHEVATSRADILHHLAECCCKLETMILAEANNTRQLIQSIEKDRLQEKLNACQQELLVARLSGAVPGGVVHAR